MSILRKKLRWSIVLSLGIDVFQRFQKCFTVGMSKEELRISNQAKKLLNPNELKATNGNRNKKRTVPLQNNPSTESLPTLAAKSSPMDDEQLISTCVNLHKTTINLKLDETIDVKCSRWRSSLRHHCSPRKNRTFVGKRATNSVKKV